MNDQIQTPADPTTLDANWHCTFYYNREDGRVIVPRRGYGLTVNFAQPMTYVLLAIPFVLGGLTVLSVWLFK